MPSLPRIQDGTSSSTGSSPLALPVSYQTPNDASKHGVTSLRSHGRHQQPLPSPPSSAILILWPDHITLARICFILDVPSLLPLIFPIPFYVNYSSPCSVETASNPFRNLALRASLSFSTHLWFRESPAFRFPTIRNPSSLKPFRGRPPYLLHLADFLDHNAG